MQGLIGPTGLQCQCHGYRLSSSCVRRFCLRHHHQRQCHHHLLHHVSFVIMFPPTLFVDAHRLLELYVGHLVPIGF